MKARHCVVWTLLAGALATAGCTGQGVGRRADEVATMKEAAGGTVLPGLADPLEGIRSGGRISAADIPALQAAGVRHVIDLTPDDETPGFDEASVVRAAGMRYDNLPIRGPADLTPENVAAFDRLLAGIERPALVHCASGNRVGALAALRAAWLDGVDDEAAVAEGRRCGLRGLEDAVRARLARERCLASATGADPGEGCAPGG